MNTFKVGDRVIFGSGVYAVRAEVRGRSSTLCSPKNEADAWLDIETSNGILYNCAPENMKHESALVALSRIGS